MVGDNVREEACIQNPVAVAAHMHTHTLLGLPRAAMHGRVQAHSLAAVGLCKLEPAYTLLAGLRHSLAGIPNHPL